MFKAKDESERNEWVVFLRKAKKVTSDKYATETSQTSSSESNNLTFSSGFLYLNKYSNSPKSPVLRTLSFTTIFMEDPINWI